MFEIFVGLIFILSIVTFLFLVGVFTVFAMESFSIKKTKELIHEESCHFFEKKAFEGNKIEKIIGSFLNLVGLGGIVFFAVIGLIIVVFFVIAIILAFLYGAGKLALLIIG